MVNKPRVKSVVLDQLQEERQRRDLQDLNRRFDRAIGHLDEIAKLSDEAYKRRTAVFDAATTGSDPQINQLASRRAQISSVSRKPNTGETKKGICRKKN